jgi:hypothetical protein
MLRSCRVYSANSLQQHLKVALGQRAVDVHIRHTDAVYLLHAYAVFSCLVDLREKRLQPRWNVVVPVRLPAKVVGGGRLRYYVYVLLLYFVKVPGADLGVVETRLFLHVAVWVNR